MEYIKYYGINTNNLKNIDFFIEKNSISSLSGPNGSGKTSLAYDTIEKISKYEYCVETSVVYKDLTQQEFDACVIFCYNIGTTGFANSSVCKMLNGQKTNYKTLDDAWMAWNKSQGKVTKGLTRRRQAELDIFHKGVYKGW